jgi:hypothetical protein
MSYYRYITEKRNDSQDLKTLMENVSNQLYASHTDDQKPGILLGLIQSGKTRAFVGIIAKCFDLGYDVAVIFTKNSVALAEQTIKRLKIEFEMPVDRNKLYIWDIIKLQNYDMLTGYVLRNKVILVVKKEAQNLTKLIDVFQNTELHQKKVLIVDDEADQASVSFVSDNTQADGIDFATIASQISTFRNNLLGNSSYLQVTATPYSLYLQPEDATLNDVGYAPLRPSFTALLKPHPAYIGGEFYFEQSLIAHSVASFIHVQVDDEELKALNTAPKVARAYNARVLTNILTTPQFQRFKLSIFNFLVGGSIRQLQEQTDDVWATPYHCAFIMHTSSTTIIHKMQKDLVFVLMDKLKELDRQQLSGLLIISYDDIMASINAANFDLPDYDSVLDAVYDAIQNNHIGVVEVNSKNQVAELLGENGQLKLDNPFNIFVGGQSLDRGITIDHLIGFFYGRNPLTYQMDTVLQHSRMYGNRSKEDLAVTRFYTSARIYEAMRQMYWFDKDLREDIERDVQHATTRFIAKQGNNIIPAGPNKLKASNLLSFKALGRLLPIGFQTRSMTDIRPIIAEIDSIISNYNGIDNVFELTFTEAKQIIKNIRDTFAYEARFGNLGLEWDIDPFIKAIELALLKNNRNTLKIYHKTSRDASRYKNNGNSFGDAPDDGRTDLPICKQLAQNTPVLMLLKQNGLEIEGWRNASFYWPVLVLPANMPNYVYCKDR